MPDFEHKEGICENIDCPERREKIRFKQLFEQKKEDRDSLYENLQKIQNILEKENLKKDEGDVKWLTKENLTLLNEKTLLKESVEDLKKANVKMEEQIKELSEFK